MDWSRRDDMLASGAGRLAGALHTAKSHPHHYPQQSQSPPSDKEAAVDASDSSGVGLLSAPLTTMSSWASNWLVSPLADALFTVSTAQVPKSELGAVESSATAKGTNANNINGAASPVISPLLTAASNAASTTISLINPVLAPIVHAQSALFSTQAQNLISDTHDDNVEDPANRAVRSQLVFGALSPLTVSPPFALFSIYEHVPDPGR
jgi:hypothetical protein